MPSSRNSESADRPKLTDAQMLDSRADEAAVLASMVIDPSVIPDVLEVLPGDGWFMHQEHRIIWRLILSLHEANGGAVDGLLLRNKIEAEPTLGAKGVEHLARIMETVPGSANAVHYAREVRDRAVRRNLLDVGRQIAGVALQPGDVATLADQAQTMLAKAVESASYQEQTTDCMAALQAAFADLENQTKPKLSTIWPSLETIVPGFRAGQMVVVAGRPAMGKTSFAFNLVLRNLVRPGGEDKRILFVSFEMTASDMMQRALSFATGVSVARMVSKTLSPEDWKAITASMGALNSLDLLFADRLQPLPSTVRNTARRLHKRKPLDAVVVDYVQRMRTAEKRATRDWEMSVISNDLKNLALELDVPVIVLSQLSRACDQRDDHRPRLSDLRDSGTIEQDADVVMFVYREDAYHRGEPGYENTNKAEIIVGKHRNGPEGVAHLVFMDKTMTFESEAIGYTGEQA